MRRILSSLFLFLCLFLCVQGSVRAATPICLDANLTISEAECEALATLYQQTLGNQRYDDTNRLTTPDVDTRYGVTITSGVVTHIDLDSNYLLGSVPSSVGDLSDLEYLSLESNLLTSVHGNIASANSLTYLNLSWNNITSLPASIGSLITLTDLNLAYNSLQTLPDTRDALSTLEHMSLEGNALSVLPPSLMHVDTLQIVNIQDNDLTVLPSTI